MNRGHRAFTLIELLVVIGIISLLLAVMTPSFVAITSLAQETSCNNNLLLVSKAAGQYMITNNDTLPINDYKNVSYDDVDANLLLPGQMSTMKWWCNKVYPYGAMKPKVYICPSDPGRANAVDPVECGYGANNTLTHPSGDFAKTTFEIRDTERTAIIGHCSSYSEEPMIHEEMVLKKEWPIGHLRRWDYVAEMKVGRCGFIMATGAVQTWRFGPAAETLDDDGNMVLFHK